MSAPTVHDGTVYITGNIDDRTVYAVDATDGTEQWQFAPDHELDTPAAAAGDLVFSSTTGASSTGSTLTQGLYPAAR